MECRAPNSAAATFGVSKQCHCQQDVPRCYDPRLRKCVPVSKVCKSLPASQQDDCREGVREYMLRIEEKQQAANAKRNAQTRSETRFGELFFSFFELPGAFSSSG